MESCQDGGDDDKQEKDSLLFAEKCVSRGSTTETTHEHHAPFEWLANLESLDPLLLLALEMSTNNNTTNSGSDSNTITPSSSRARVLDVGCGRSILGEYLLEHPTLNRLVSQVVNVDKDPATLQAMQERWKQKTSSSSSSRNNDDDDDMEKRLLFLAPTDFVTQSIDCPPWSSDGSAASSSSSSLFHLIVDKGTLDCTLCADFAAAALICQVYRLLRPENGVYLIISFHHVDFLRPLLQDCPGTDWELTFHVINREIQKDNGTTTTTTSSVFPPQPNSSCLIHNNGTDDTSSVWSSGCFNPNESYRRTVNAVLCRRRGSNNEPSETTAAAASCDCNLDRNAVYQHINDTLEQWYRFQNPMLTEARSKELEQAFLSSSSSSCQEDGDEQEKNRSKLHHNATAAQKLDLPSAFVALFTQDERENLTYEHFLEDWHAFHNMRPELPVDTISYETAVAFLQEMQ